VNYKLEKADKKLNDYKAVEDDNKKLKRELATTKVKLRNSSSKDKKMVDTNLSKWSFASRIFGTSEGKNASQSRERSNTDRSSVLTSKLEGAIERYKMKINVLQSTNDKIVNENAILRLRLEELEKYGYQGDSIEHNNKLASNIARKELKILKIYQEWAEEVVWMLWKKSLPPNKFYSHECIQSLIGWDEDLDIMKSEFVLKKILQKETYTPIDDCKTVKRDPKLCSPIKSNLSEHKNFMECHLTTTDLLVESDCDIRLLNENRNNDSYYNTKPKYENNSYYKTNSTKPLIIPSSWNSKYETQMDSEFKFGVKKKNEEKNKNQSVARKSATKDNNSKNRNSCKKKKTKDFSKLLSEKVLEGSKASSRNMQNKGFDQFSNTMTKLDKNNTKRSRVAKLNLYPHTSIENKTLGGVINCKNLITSEKTCQNNLWHVSENTSETVLKETNSMVLNSSNSDKKLISSLKKIEESNPSTIYDKKTNFSKISNRFDMFDKIREKKYINPNPPISMVGKYMSEKNKNTRNSAGYINSLRYSNSQSSLIKTSSFLNKKNEIVRSSLEISDK